MKDIALAAPLVEQLSRFGIHVDSVWDLVNTLAQYPIAIPTLVEHLTRPYPDDVLEGIARALAVPGAKAAWPTLMELFRRRSGGGNDSVKMALACALSAVSDDDVIGDMIDLVGDPSNGPDRLLLLNALGRSNRRAAHQALEKALEDPQLKRQARVELRLFRSHMRKTALDGDP